MVRAQDKATCGTSCATLSVSCSVCHKGSAGSCVGESGPEEITSELKYRFPTKTVHPFIDGGVAWDALTGVSNAANGVAPVRKTVNGIVMGAGDVH